MATRYIYNEQKYTSLYSLRQAIWKNESKAYGEPKTQEEFDNLGLKVTIEEYDPLDEIDLEVFRKRKESELNSAFNRYRVSKYTKIVSSLGFPVNANDDAFVNVQGCIDQIECGVVKPKAEGQPATITFMDFNNAPHDLKLEELKTIKGEIAANGSRAYGKKWEYRNKIASASREDLKFMHSFSFE